ncbi:hypothetical protein GCM10022256_26170 [Frondihabitans peucedani]|uniref:Uncharacterized protein n=1 Tax=Frondihabitans peucedani TaxID=598626 RepID=A0ABP8E430_9MICO
MATTFARRLAAFHFTDGLGWLQLSFPVKHEEIEPKHRDVTPEVTSTRNVDEPKSIFDCRRVHVSEEPTGLPDLTENNWTRGLFDEAGRWTHEP